MQLLILGGTVFVGYHLVQSALRAGHEVTIFTRGQHESEPMPEVEKLRGNRDGDLDALRGRRWDAVIDTSGYVPRIVRDSASLLADAVDHYTFISSISVYGDLSQPGVNENAPVGKLEDESTEDVPKYYGELKALCERTIESKMPGRVLNVRPGLIVGPQDPTDRFTYWPVRIHKGGRVLVPGNPDAGVQFIDVRDLADWVIRMVEAKHTGVYNATGPADRLSMKSFVDRVNECAGSDAEFIWVEDEFLLERGVQPWVELPLWIPPHGDYMKMANLHSVNIEKALAAGLTFRPLAETVRDTIAWDADRPADLKRRAGMDPEKEASLLAEWMKRRS